MKKLLTIVFALMLAIVACVSCGNDSSNASTKDSTSDTSSAATSESTGSGEKVTVKAGLIALHDQNSTYDKNFIDAFVAACNAKGIDYLIKTNIGEDSGCYDAAAELVDEGCNYIFADSFGHESHILRAAEEFPDVQFSHATGTTAHTEKLANFHNAFASIYEGRYIAGVAAGLKLKDMMEKDSSVKPVVGYVGAFTYAEVISGYTSWYLGVKSIVPDVTMKVQFTGSWYDQTAEMNAAQDLIKKGCVLISQHADSMGAPNACETAGVPNVSYNGSTETACPNTFIISSRINWQPYYEYCIDAIANGRTIDADWCGELGDTRNTGSVCYTELGKIAPVAGTDDKLAEVAAQIKSGALKIFDVSKFTVTVTDSKNKNAKVDGEGHLTSYMADVDTDPNYAADTEAVKTENGVTYFAESLYRSAPYFDVQIDGIELLNVAYGD